MSTTWAVAAAPTVAIRHVSEMIRGQMWTSAEFAAGTSTNTVRAAADTMSEIATAAGIKTQQIAGVRRARDKRKKKVSTAPSEEELLQDWDKAMARRVRSAREPDEYLAEWGQKRPRRRLAARRFAEKEAECEPGRRCFRAWIDTEAGGGWVLVGEVSASAPRLAARKVVNHFVRRRGYRAHRIAVDESRGAHAKHAVSVYTFKGDGKALKVGRMSAGRVHIADIPHFLAGRIRQRPKPKAKPKPKSKSKSPPKPKPKSKSKSPGKPKAKSKSPPRPKAKSKSPSKPKAKSPQRKTKGPSVQRKLPVRAAAVSHRAATRSRQTYTR